MTMYWMIAQAETEAQTEGTVITSETAAPAADTTSTGTQAPGGPAGTDTPTGTNTGSKNTMWQLAPIVVLIVLMYFVMLRAPKKRQQEHQKMVAGLKKNDRIRTIGGILGTVLDVRDDEIVIKIDEANNTKMRVVPSAVAAVLSEEKKNQ